MKKEDKILLADDLCGRIPYGVKIMINGWTETLASVKRCTFGLPEPVFLVHGHCHDGGRLLENVKPYLRRMRDMTEDDMEDYARFKFKDDQVYRVVGCRKTGKGFVNVHTENRVDGTEGYTFQVNSRTMLGDGSMGIAWLNSRHFDYRDLIGKGLALEAPEGMYQFGDNDRS